MKNIGGNQGQLFITEDDIKAIAAKYGYRSADIQSYKLSNAVGDKVLGFLAEYWRLEINIFANKEKKLLSFFIKKLPTANEAKAEMVKEIGIFDRELEYYQFVNSDLQVPALKPWSATFVTVLGDASVMEDLAAKRYIMRSKFEHFDKKHTLQALKTLARFHASTIIYEEKRIKELQRPYTVLEDHTDYLDKILYSKDQPWFIQCRDDTLEVVKALSKYSQDKEALILIEERWVDVWNAALEIPTSSCKERSVICHRDLWNNNLLFHYKELEDTSLVPDDCVLVDFQMIRYQPPASDVMMLLHCNLEPEFRKQNLSIFLNFYYDALQSELANNDIDIQKTIPRDNFMAFAKKLNQYGLIVFACLGHIVLPSDEVLIEVLGDPTKFSDLMTKDKITFVKKMMHRSNTYKKTVMDTFEEIIDDYILNQ